MSWRTPSHIHVFAAIMLPNPSPISQRFCPNPTTDPGQNRGQPPVPLGYTNNNKQRSFCSVLEVACKTNESGRKLNWQTPKQNESKILNYWNPNCRSRWHENRSFWDIVKRLWLGDDLCRCVSAVGFRYEINRPLRDCASTPQCPR